MSVSENGIMQPNPVLFELEQRKKKGRLGHELGAGAKCTHCLHKCPGFQLHFWRKVCLNCRCGKMEHNVEEMEDQGFVFVGKIFDRPLRSVKEELEFCYESPHNNESLSNSSTKVKFDWIPPNTSSSLIKRYLESLPYLPIHGTDGAKIRKQFLEKQFPVHDIEPKKCHNLTEPEIDTMNTFVDNVKENVVGQGIVTEIETEDDFPPPPPPLTLDSLYISDDEFPEPPHISSPPTPPPPKTLSPKCLSKIGNCHDCQKSLHPGDVAIKAERAGPEQLWHSTCFKCSICHELLVDLLYYFYNGKLFCGRDFAIHVSKIPRCAACDELIFASEYTGAENKVFHIRHFCCYSCDKPLGGHKYIPVEGQPHCLQCFQTSHGKVCCSCNEYISPTEQRFTLGSNHWHSTPECFSCFICKISLIGSKIIHFNNKILCSSLCKKELNSVVEAVVA